MPIYKFVYWFNQVFEIFHFGSLGHIWETMLFCYNQVVVYLPVQYKQTLWPGVGKFLLRQSGQWAKKAKSRES